jgi:two-component system cell cycle sensor histidine kinase/response regulator CckA
VTVVDVNQVVTDTNSTLQRLIGSHITMKTQLSADPAFVSADAAEIEQALINLVINAHDAMPDGGTLTIRTRIATLEEDGVPKDCKAGHFVQLSVADDGCGMPPETLERIFEPFFTTKPVGKGTGLGLSTVYSGIKNCGGFISVESHEGTGTVVDVYLPQSQESAVEAASAETESPSSDATGGGETILVCDDEEIVLSAVSTLLKTVGYSVITTKSAKEALVAADAHAGEISLLLTDLTMPEMGGLELGKEIHRRNPHIKTLYMSGYAADHIETCAAGDHVEFFEKGQSSRVMCQRIRKLLDRNTPSDLDNS